MKVLVIRFSSIGDIVLTSPVLRCLKEQVPGVEIHLLTKAVFRDLVAHSPHVSKVHVIGEDLGEVIPALKREGFAQVIDLHHNLRSWRVKRALGAPCSSFHKLNIAKWLLVNLKRDRMPRAADGRAPLHIVDRYMATVAHLGVRNDGRGLELHIPREREVDLDTLPVTHRSGYTALCIGAAHATKRLPPHKLVAIAQALQGPLVIIGGRDDQAVGRRIADAVGAHALDATGRYDLLGSASLIGRARTVIAHDSGAMHVACALNRPVVSVWGSTVPLFGMGPYMPQHPERAHVMEIPDLHCRPCSKIGFDHCPKGHFHCMEKQDPARIAALAGGEAQPAA